MHAARAQPGEMPLADQQPGRRRLLLLRERASQRTALLPGTRAHRVPVGRSTVQQRGCVSDDCRAASSNIWSRPSIFIGSMATPRRTTWCDFAGARQPASVIRTRIERVGSAILLSLIRAKSLPGSAPQAPGHAVARDRALLPSRDDRFVARARRA